MSLKDNRELLVIDYEYAGWNPMAMDIANYLNETMLDNAYPYDKGIGYYTDNCMSIAEVEDMTRVYMATYFNHYMKEPVRAKFNNDLQTFISSELNNLVREVLDCALLNDFFWGIWAVALLNKDTCTEKGIFNYQFGQYRIDLYNAILDLKKAYA